MYRLTEKRFAKVLDILEKFREQLNERGAFHAGSLEHELRQRLDTGYRELKWVMEQLLKQPLYRLVAAYYMQYVDFCVVSEFKPHLAILYGLKTYDCPEREERQREFWKAVKRKPRFSFLGESAGTR